MRAMQKIALSLLISVVAFSLFALFAFSGFFSLIESNFYDVRVRQQIAERLSATAGVLATYEKRYFTRFSAIVSQNSVKRINIVNQSAQDIFNRKNLFRRGFVKATRRKWLFSSWSIGRSKKRPGG